MKMEFELQKVKYYNLDKGIVTIYVVDNVYLVTYDDTSNEIIWGYGATPKTALLKAKKEWERLVGDENPFTLALEEERHE